MAHSHSSSDASTSASSCGDSSSSSSSAAQLDSPVQLSSSVKALCSLITSFHCLTRRLPSLPPGGGYLPLHASDEKQWSEKDKHFYLHQPPVPSSSSSSSTSYLHPPISSAMSSSSSCSPSPRSSFSLPCPGRPYQPPPRHTCRNLILSLIQLVILIFALIGLAAIVAYATGLFQKTPLYSEKALQDAGWTRRPISISEPDSSSSSQHPIPLVMNDVTSSAITIHDFTPSLSSPRLDGMLDSQLQHSVTATRTSPPTFSSRQVPSNELHLLILCPLRNAASHLPHFFSLLDNMTHPFANTSLGFLVGDESDNTGEVLHNLVESRMRHSERRYRHVSLLHKDFNVVMPTGAARHTYFLQQQRRYA